MQYCSLQHQTLLPSPVTSTNGHCFHFGSFASFSGVISPLFCSSILGTYQPQEFSFQCDIFLPFHAVHGVLKARILKWFAIPFSSGPRFVRTEVNKCRSYCKCALIYIYLLYFYVTCPCLYIALTFLLPKIYICSVYICFMQIYSYIHTYIVQQ